MKIPHCRFCDNTFTEMFLDWVPWQPKGKICKKRFKNQHLRCYVGDKAEALQNCYQNYLYKTIVFYCSCSSTLVNGNLKFPLTYHGKSENSDLLLSHCRCFDKSFTEMFVEWSSIKRIMLVQTSQFDWLPWQPKG